MKYFNYVESVVSNFPDTIRSTIIILNGMSHLVVYGILSLNSTPIFSAAYFWALYVN
jgi:hypothetical protein